jgi:hypothetical protein
MTSQRDARSFWLEVLIFVAVVTLLFQLFPNLWWGALAVIDVRNWTWKSYAVASSIAVVVLVALRAWSER